MINGFFLQTINHPELILNNMLKNVTIHTRIKQLSRFTCFIIHVDSSCVGEKAYA